jgi:hypothetical protein
MERPGHMVDVVDDEMAALLRTKTPAQRLAATHAMWRQARRRLVALLRHQHPEWNDDQLKAEIWRRTIGTR